MEFLEEFKQNLTEEELELALNLGIVQLIYIKLSQFEQQLTEETTLH